MSVGISILFHKGGDFQAGVERETTRVNKEWNKPPRTLAQTSQLKIHHFYTTKHSLHLWGWTGEKKGHHNYKTIPELEMFF